MSELIRRNPKKNPFRVVGLSVQIRVDACPTKKVAFSKIEETGRRRRPPTRWFDVVQKDFELTGINRWKAVVTDRVNWRRISESALACKNC
ncbi:hypothetical protein TNCV_1976771 [Trichonephila clavipes]|nr:hypothetical protein TNCV_1976771 [Trichonephila clavipes]